MRSSNLLLLTMLVVAFATGGAVFAQTATPTPAAAAADDGEVIKVSSRLVVVPVSVTDKNGEPVMGLKAENFRVREENKQQAVDSLGTAESVPLEIALLFDISASSDAMFRFQQETAAKFLQEVLRADDRATVFTIGQKATMIGGREPADRSVAAVKSITPTREQTAFYDSVRIAADYLRKNAPEGRRKVILVISDGEDTNSDGVLKAIWAAESKLAENVAGAELRSFRVKARDTAKVAEQVRVLKSLQDADAVLYAINPGGGSIQLNQMAVFGQENMQRFADETGGAAFLPKFQPVEAADQMANSVNIRKNTEMLERIFRQIANELRAQYLVQYYSESEFPANRFVKVDVDVKSANTATIRARKGYYVKN